MTEKDLQKNVLAVCRRFGWRACHFSDSRKQVRPGVFVGDVDARGFPDVVAVKRNRVLFVELKSERGRLSEHQKFWLSELSAAGCEVFVWRPEHYHSGALHKVLMRELNGPEFGSWVDD